MTTRALHARPYRRRLAATARVAPVDISIAFVILVVALAVRAPTMRQPLVEAHGFRQTQTAYTALLFHEHGISLLHSELPVLGQPWSIPFEFPLFQAIASVPMDLGVTPDLAMRLTALAFFAITALLVFGFVRSRAGPVEAVASLCFFTLSPFSLIWSRASLMEYMATAGAVAWCWALLAYRDSGRRLPLVLGVLAGTIRCLVKITSGLFWVAPVLLANSARDSGTGLRGWVRSRLDLRLAIGLLVPLAITEWWVRYSDHVKAMNLQGAHLTSAALFDWNFGTIHQRLEPSTWTTILDRIDPTITGGVIWGGLMLAAVLLGSRRGLWIGIAVAVAAPIATFFNLYYVHEYYLSAATPGIAMLMGVGLVALLRASGTMQSRLLPAALVVLGIWVATTLAFEEPYWRLAYTTITPSNNETLAIAQSLASVTAPNDLVVIDGFDWSPEVLYYARRRGTMLRFVDPQVLDGIPLSYRAMLIHDPGSANLPVLRRWRWIEPVTPNILRMANGRSGLPASSIQATTDAALAGSQSALGRQLLPPTALSCAPGSSLSIPNGTGTAWVRFAPGLPDQTRIVVGAGLAPLPGVAAIVISPDPATGVRSPVALSCGGATSVEVTGVDVVRS